MPQIDISDDLFNYMLEVYMENCIELSIPSRRAQVNHVSNAVMIGIHNLFPIDKDDDKYAISLKKIIERRACGQLVRMFWYFTLIVTQGSI